MKRKGTRIFALLLAAVLLLGGLPMQALAAEDEAGWFHLAADWNGELLIKPERVPYTAEQTIYEAICAAGHTLAPNAGNVTQIDGVAGNFIRGDETGADNSYDLTRKASEAKIQYFCFVDNSSGSRTATPSVTRQALIAVMAEYARKDADVQAAAKAEYDAACKGYCTADDTEAERLCAALTDAINRYEQGLNGTKYTVSFTDTNGVWKAGDLLTAKNAYGRVYSDENGNGVLELPAGDYTFTMEAAASGVTGSISVPAQRTVSVAVDKTDWLLADEFQLSSRPKSADFKNNRFSVEKKSARELETVVIDNYSGTLYAYWRNSGTTAKIPELNAVYVPAGATEHVKVPQVLSSYTSGIDHVLSAGAEGSTVIYRASMELGGSNYYQDYTLRIRRAPTLKEVRVTETNGSPAALESYAESTKTYTYLVLGSKASLALTPSVEDGCSIYVNEKAVKVGEAVQIDVGQTNTTVKIRLEAGGAETEYTLVLRPSTSCMVQIPIAADDISLTVCDENGQTVYGSFNASLKTYRYSLIPGRRYTYTATKNQYYHAAETFTAAAKTLSKVDVETGEWLTDLALAKDGAKDSKGNIELDQGFTSNIHRYTAVVPDTPPAVYLWVDGEIETANTGFSARYRTIASTGQDEQEVVCTISSEELGTPLFLQKFLLNQSGRGNLLTVRYSRTDGTVTYYQDYEIEIRRSFSLKSLAVFCGGQEAVLTHGGGASGYTPSVWDYIVTVPAAAKELSICASVYDADGAYRDHGQTGYRVWLGERELTSGEAALVALCGDTTPETITLTVTNDFAEGVSSNYTILVQKAKPVRFTPELTPETALLFLREDLSGRRVWPDEIGAFELSEGFSYSYLLTCAGYVGRTGTLGTAHSGDGELILRIDTTDIVVKDGAASAQMALQAAKPNQTLKMLPAEWADFRGTSYAADGTMGGSKGTNNTVLSVKTPITAEGSTLYWASKLGDGFDSGATGCPLLVDDVLITYAGSTIYRVDPVSGEILTQAEMDRASSFAITPPAYAKGMIFVGLADGTIQAFDAKTLKSLWVYHDPLKGQPNCPITICGDYLYTGFWRGEEFTANFVCLSITDEQPLEEKEEKTACWYWTQQGGFYWAGAYACEDYVLVGTDDGVDGYRSKTGSLLMLDAKTGRLLDQWTGLLGDVRSTVCYDAETKSFYFTTKGGWFCGVQTEQTADGWRLKERSKWTLKLENGSDTEPAMSTSTPTVYNGRAYIGVSGALQFGAFSGHSITVVDLNKRDIAYKAETLGYPQTSGILTTAYKETTKHVYVYFIDNYTPGKLRVLQDELEQTEPKYLTKEYDSDTPYILFTPSGDEAQYAICTPVVDSYGVMYFKNDTARMMAFGPSATLEITTPPTKTTYRVGETFDASGMKAELVYANGQRRDVTKYVTWSTEPLTEQDAEFAISFPYVKYHDVDGEDGHQSNIRTETPFAALTLTISTGMEPERIGELSWTYAEMSGKLSIKGEFNGQTLIAACYDANGRMLEVQTLANAGDLKLNMSSAKIRLFLLDKNSKPVCAAVTVKETTS